MNICVIGDAFIDRYVVGTSTRISPEAPVPVMIVKSTFDREGGAKNVYNNMRIDCEYIDNDEQGLNIKTRYICNGQQVLRIDTEGYKRSQVQFPRCDMVVVSDYNKGNICDFQYVKSNSNIQIVDAKKMFSDYAGATVLKCNESEYLKFSGGFELNSRGMEECRIFHKFDTLIVTRAENPVMVAHDFVHFQVPVPKVEVRDVTGAGDVFLAVFASNYASTKNVKTAIEIAIKAAAISCKHFGTYKLTDEEYESCIH